MKSPGSFLPGGQRQSRKPSKLNSKVNGEQVMQMRKLYAEGWTQGSLCREFGLSIGQVGKIVRGESWTHLPTIRTDEEAQATKLMEDLAVVGLVKTDEAAKASQERLLALLEKQEKEDEKNSGFVEARYSGKPIDFDKILEREEPEGRGMERLMEEARKLNASDSAASPPSLTEPIDAGKLLDEL